MRRGRWSCALLVAGLVVGGAACGGGSDDGAARLRIDDAWARTTPPGAIDGAAYLTVTVPEDDRLIAATVPGSVAQTTMLHATTGGESSGAGHAHHGGGDASGTVTMTEMGAVELRGGEPYVFAPGGSHVMLVGLRSPLAAGDRFPMVLEFERRDPVTVKVKVRDNPPGV